jgi:hypothetical protein
MRNLLLVIIIIFAMVACNHSISQHGRVSVPKNPGRKIIDLYKMTSNITARGSDFPSAIDRLLSFQNPQNGLTYIKTIDDQQGSDFIFSRLPTRDSKIGTPPKFIGVAGYVFLNFPEPSLFQVLTDGVILKQQFKVDKGGLHPLGPFRDDDGTITGYCSSSELIDLFK